jgi:putative peptide zinc metalloprotease protein
MDPAFITDAERRKLVRIRARPDLLATPQRYEGRKCHVVKDPVALKYYRFNEQEYFVFKLLDGKHTLDDVQKQFEQNFRPHRLTLEDLEGFARQLVTSGLVHHESAHAGKHLFERRRKQNRTRRLASLTNILYIKIPIFDPDRILTWMYRYLWWIFTYWFLALSVGLMLAAAAFVTIKFQVFWDKLPAYHEFFQFRTLLYMWIALGVVKVIHEFGHGLSCKAFGGECHEMGFLFMCFSPAMYCNVSDAWTLANKWQRIVISFAGIYVELVIAAISTFVWWSTPHWPVVNNIALCLMVLCSVSTFVFNANPLMRFDGYYILADWLEVPNLRERSNRFLSQLVQAKCLGIEVPPERYMATGRKVLFVSYAILSYIYRWVVTFSILYFLWGWLKPYKLEALSALLTIAAVGAMVFWPLFRLGKNIRQRGRLPDMKRKRVAISLLVLAALIAAFFTLPVPVSRITETGLVQVQEQEIVRVYPSEAGVLEVVHVYDGQHVVKDQELAEFSDPRSEADLAQVRAELQQYTGLANSRRALIANTAVQSDPMVLVQYRSDLNMAEGKLKGLRTQEEQLINRINALKTLRAPRDGTVMSPPRKEELFKKWEKTDATPFCSIGDTKRLRILLPVTPPDYRLIRENLDERGGRLEVLIHVPGRFDKVFQGWITRLPESDAKEVPVGLTHRGGGSLAVKPSNDPHSDGRTVEPLVQTYLVAIDIEDPDPAFCPGTLVKVQVQNRWKPISWWAWRAISSALDLGLM